MELQIRYVQKTGHYAANAIISHIAGMDRSGAFWVYPVEQAAEIIEAGRCMFYVEHPLSHKHYLVVAKEKDGHPYLKTREDGPFPNHLLDLPDCPPFLHS